MEMADVLEAAEAESAAARVAIGALIKTEFLRFSDLDLLSLATSIERTARLVFTAQVRIAGAIDNRKMADTHGASSASALLQQTLQISALDARQRLNTAKAILPQDAVSGGVIDPVLPLLGA